MQTDIRTAWALIIFQASPAFRKSFVPFKHACMKRVIFTASLSQYLKSFRRGFLQFNEKLDVNSFTFAVLHFPTRIITRLYLNMRPLALSKAIELSLVTLCQVRTYSIAVCLSLPSHSWFPSYRVSLFFCVSDHVYLCISRL